MRNELDFGEYSHILGEGLFADKVILALSKFSETRQLGECPACKAKADKVGVHRLYFDYVKECCQYVIEKGRIKFSGTMDELRENQEIQKKYLMI